jgi:hypothetical protein
MDSLEISPQLLFNELVFFMKTNGRAPEKINLSKDAKFELEKQLYGKGWVKEPGNKFMGIQIVPCVRGWFVS